MTYGDYTVRGLSEDIEAYAATLPEGITLARFGPEELTPAVLDVSGDEIEPPTYGDELAALRWELPDQLPPAESLTVTLRQQGEPGFSGEAPIAPVVLPDPLPTDTPLTRVQFVSILAILGKSMDEVNAAIDVTIIDPVQNAIAKARVAHSENYQRDNPLFSLLGPSLGFTDAQLDAAWPTALAI